MTQVSEAAAEVTKGRRNTIGNFLVEKIDRDVLEDFIDDEDLDIAFDDETTDEQLAVSLAMHFQGTTTHENMIECDRCEGHSPEVLASCPYCGLEGNIVPGAAASSTAQASEEEDDDEDTEEDDEDADAEPAHAEEADAAPLDDEPEPAAAAPPAKKAAPKKAAAPKKKEEKKMNGEMVNGHSTKAIAKAPAKLTEKDLDRAVGEAIVLKSKAAGSYWELGTKIREIVSKNLWKFRTDDEGKLLYKGFDSFVNKELGMSPTHAYSLVNIAKNFTEKDVKEFGTKKLTLLLKAPPEDRDKLKAKIKTGTSHKGVRAKGGLGSTELEREVKKLRSEKNYTEGGQHAAAGKKGGKARAVQTREKITVANIEGRKQVKLFAKPETMKGLDFSALKRAKNVKQKPFGRLELVNGVFQYYSVMETEGGLVLVVETRREHDE